MTFPTLPDPRTIVTARDATSLGTVLGVWAHPDDETYLSSGLMALARRAGSRVVCATATRGELGTDDPDRWPPERLAGTRDLEVAAAMAVLGVEEHRCFGLPDGALSAHDRRDGIERVHRLVDEVRPDTIVTFGPDGATFHPDHVCVHHWVVEAWERRGRAARLLQAALTTDHLHRFGALYERWGVYMTAERPQAHPAGSLAVHLELEGPALDRKLTALRAMATQTAPAVELMGEELFAAQASEEAFIEAGRQQVSGTSRPGRSSTSASRRPLATSARMTAPSRPAASR
jgi:LmbE family N-acetylglucosaminyl deacetylase